MAAAWVEEELQGVDFGDKRLDKRLKRCVEHAASIGESTPDRTRSKADLKATYRFVDNRNVNMDIIFGAHNHSARDRCGEHQRVYLVQDTTDVDVTRPNQHVQGAGPLGTGQREGFFHHALYSVTDTGLSLGCVDQLVWTRDPKSLEIPTKEREVRRKQACFEEKESCRWLEMMQSGEQIARSMPETQFIMVADSECDICELFVEAADLPSNYDFIIRERETHTVVSSMDPRTRQEIEAINVDQALDQVSWQTQRTAQVGGRDAPVLPNEKKRSRQQARTAREAELSIRGVTVVIAGPRRFGGGKLPDVELNVVEVLETNPPENEVPIHWVLYTSLPIASNEDLHEVVNGYCHRWQVELYFKTLKSGLRIEDMKYETLSRYLNAFAILSVAAWRIEYLKGAARADPDSSCEKYFPSHEWMAIVTFVNRRPADPTQPPTTRQFMLLVAQLGGYINKKSQGDPGSKTIWRGMSRFDTIVEAFATFNQVCK